MNLAEKYGIQKTVEVDSIDLNQNPYTFEGTFMEVYNLVAEGRLHLLKQGNMVVGGSVTGYDTVEQDNLAGMAFTRAFMFKPLMEYLELAVSLVEANLIPELVSETPFRISILNVVSCVRQLIIRMFFTARLKLINSTVPVTKKTDLLSG